MKTTVMLLWLLFPVKDIPEEVIGPPEYAQAPAEGLGQTPAEEMAAMRAEVARLNKLVKKLQADVEYEHKLATVAILSKNRAAQAKLDKERAKRERRSREHLKTPGLPRRTQVLDVGQCPFCNSTDVAHENTRSDEPGWYECHDCGMSYEAEECWYDLPEGS